MEWRNIYRGILMGISDIVPGVSGGTIAVVLGIYQRLIEAINGVLSREWKKHFAFLIPLGVGVLFALFTLANAIDWLFEHYPNQIQFLFIGLIIGIIPMLLKKANVSSTFGATHYSLFVLAAILVASMAFFQEGVSDAITTFDARTYVLLFLSGWLASSAMILPGISGSMLLLIVGMYPTFTYVLGDVIIQGLIPLALGIGFGLLVMSKIIRYFLTHYFYQMYALIIGLVVGSVVVVYPGFQPSFILNIISVALIGVGIYVAVLLGKLEHQG
ncbi:putative membrane protein [Alkalibacillus flavidus]|uniref:Membrane protein n=1 Tax=Alkalibacillus flavidus TaxID=546021 RepID=A0ABV2KWH2_9BACI